MTTSSNKVIYVKACLAASLAAAGCAFQTQPSVNRVGTALKVALDPSVVSKKEFEDICGVGFDSQSLEERLKATNYLYPKHVEVIEDIAPIAGKMVDDVVSRVQTLFATCCPCMPF